MLPIRCASMMPFPHSILESPSDVIIMSRGKRVFYGSRQGWTDDPVDNPYPIGHVAREIRDKVEEKYKEVQYAEYFGNLRVQNSSGSICISVGGDIIMILTEGSAITTKTETAMVETVAGRWRNVNS